MKYCAAYYSDIGIQKETNQDSLLLVQRGQTQDDEAVLAVICDGVGGLKMGERSSAAVVTAFRDWFDERVEELYEQEEPETELFDDWDNLIQSLHIRLKDNSEKAGFRSGTTVETVVLLSKGEIDSKKVRVEFSLEDMDMSGFQKGATYEQIKAYVLEHTGLKVSSLYISQIKRKCGLDVGQNYNLSKKEDAKVPKCPPEKEAAIRDALKYFQMI